jgi:hypothetical protein
MQDDVGFFGSRHDKDAHDGAWVVIKCCIHYEQLNAHGTKLQNSIYVIA